MVTSRQHRNTKACSVKHAKPDAIYKMTEYSFFIAITRSLIRSVYVAFEEALDRLTYKITLGAVLLLFHLLSHFGFYTTQIKMSSHSTNGKDVYADDIRSCVNK